MSYRVFMVDDDRFLLDMYALKFKAAGHDAVPFSGGQDLLDALKDKPAPDAILLDIIMPGMDGFQVLEAIRKGKLVPEKTKVVVLSNQGQDADIEKAKSLGAAGYIVKASAIPSEVLSQTVNIIEGKS
jgi:CheY-like chemotaxis protein